MKDIGTEVTKIVRNIFKYKDPILAELIFNWSKIVGIKFSNKTYPMKVSNYKEKGRLQKLLIIKSSNEALSLELSFQQDIIIERLAVYLGYKAINKIRVINE